MCMVIQSVIVQGRIRYICPHHPMWVSDRRGERPLLYLYGTHSLSYRVPPEMGSHPPWTCFPHMFLRGHPTPTVYLIRFDLSGDVYYFYTDVVCKALRS